MSTQEVKTQSAIDQTAIQALSREFIKQNAKKYKLMYPRMSQWAIYQKIGREWQNLTQKEVAQMYNRYILHGFITNPHVIKVEHVQTIPVQNVQEKQKPIKLQQVSQDKLQSGRKKPIAEVENQVKSNSSRITRRSQKERQGKVKKEESMSESYQQTISQSSQFEDAQLLPKLWVGSNLKEKLKRLGQTEPSSAQFYRALIKSAKDQFKQIASKVVTFQQPPIQVQNSQNIRQNNQINQQTKPLDTIVEKPRDQQAQSQLSPEQPFKSNRIKLKQKQEVSACNKESKLHFEIRLRPQSNNSQATQTQFLTIKLEQKCPTPKKTNDYLEFYKYGFKKLKDDCSYLAGNEITRILRTIWQKQKAMKKQTAKKNSHLQKQSFYGSNDKKIRLSSVLARKIGKINFIKEKIKESYSKEQAEQLWAFLPMQSKLCWIYPQNSYSRFVKPNLLDQQQSTVRYRSRQSEDSKCYELNWQIFDQLQKQCSFESSIHDAGNEKI